MNRKQLQRQIIKLFYRLGIYIDIEFFPSVHKLSERLAHKPPQKQVAELEKICSAVGAAKDHQYYNQLLKEFIPEWDLKIDHPKFLGTGQWSGFNSFRKVEIDGQKEFEKLFDSESRVPEKLIWLEEKVFPLLNIQTPKITRHYQGEVLSLIYFEFLSAAPLQEKQGEKPAIEISKQLYEFSLNREFLNLNIPKNFSDFHHYNRYKMWVSKAHKELGEEGIPVQHLEKALRSGRQVLTHGDLKDLNLFKDGSLIDWDEAGVFPAGLEQAFIYSRNILHYDLIEKSPLDWLNQHYKSLVPQEEWKLFELSFVYFLFVFSVEKLSDARYNSLKKELIRELKSSVF